MLRSVNVNLPSQGQTMEVWGAWCNISRGRGQFYRAEVVKRGAKYIFNLRFKDGNLDEVRRLLPAIARVGVAKIDVEFGAPTLQFLGLGWQAHLPQGEPVTLAIVFIEEVLSGVAGERHDHSDSAAYVPGGVIVR